MWDRNWWRGRADEGPPPVKTKGFKIPLSLVERLLDLFGSEFIKAVKRKGRGKKNE